MAVHRKIYAQFVEKFIAQVGALKVGDGLDPSTQMGPCVNEQQLNTVMKYVQIGKDETAKLATGGHRLTGDKWKNGPCLRIVRRRCASPRKKFSGRWCR